MHEPTHHRLMDHAPREHHPRSQGAGHQPPSSTRCGQGLEGTDHVLGM